VRLFPFVESGIASIIPSRGRGSLRPGRAGRESIPLKGGDEDRVI